jgi:hypothetical protein
MQEDDLEEDEEPVEQPQNSQPKGKAAHLAPWQFKKGQSGNPLGRTPGKSLKEFAKEYFEGMNKADIWKMAEGNPENKTDLTSDGSAIAGFNFIKNGNDKAA